MAYKRLKDIHLNGAKTISEAIRSGAASFGLDDAILRNMKTRGVVCAGVYVKETGDKFLAPLPRFFDNEIAKPRTARCGLAIERHLPLSRFRFRAGRVKL